MNWLRWIGLWVVLSILWFVIAVTFFSRPVDMPSIVVAENETLPNQQPLPLSQLDDQLVQKEVVDAVDAYHYQVQSHVAGSRFEWVLARYTQTKDLELLGVLIDTWLQWWEYEVIRKELSLVDLDDPKVVETIWPQRILSTLFAVTPLTIKSYERLKSVVDRYESQWLITLQQKHAWYGLVALAKWNQENFEYFVEQSWDEHWKAVVASVRSTQETYTYAPKSWWIGLYAIAMYEAWQYRVSQNVAKVLQKKHPDFALWYQLEAWSTMQLHERSRAELAAQQATKYDTNIDSHDQYRMIEAIATYHQWAYARSIILFNQLKRSHYHDDAVRYLFKIAKQTNQWIGDALKTLQWISLNASDYYEIISLLYPSSSWLNWVSATLVNKTIEACKGSIETSYSYICLMWKAWLLYRQWDYQKSIIVLKQITDQFPTWDWRELLAESYRSLNKKNLARQAYNESLRYGQWEQFRARVQDRLDSFDT